MNQMKPLRVEFVWLTNLIFNESNEIFTCGIYVAFLIFNESNETFTSHHYDLKICKMDG